MKEHTYVVERPIQQADLYRACVWAGEQALAGRTTLRMVPDEKVYLITADYPAAATIPTDDAKSNDEQQ